MPVWSWQFLQFTVFKHCLVQFINFLVLWGVVKRVYFAISAEFFRLIVEALGVSGGLKSGVERIMVVFVLEVADLVLVVEIKKVESVQNEALLDDHVQGRVSGETWAVVDLQEQWLKVLLDEDIEA